MKAGTTKAELASSPRQLSAVIDLGKCMGCQTCVMACKSLWTQRPGTEHMRWMSVATCPGRGYPRDFEQKGGGFDAEGRPRKGELTTLVDCGDSFRFNHDEVLFAGNGQATKLEPRSAHGGRPEWGYNWDEDQASGDWPNPYFFYMPRLCNHCTKPACLEACTRNAIYKREDGLVVIDQSKCEGHRHCVEACPYDALRCGPDFELAHTSREEPMIDLIAIAAVDRETEMTYIRREPDWAERALAAGRDIGPRMLPVLPASISGGHGNGNGNGHGDGHGGGAHDTAHAPSSHGTD